MVYGDWLTFGASSGHLKNCGFWHFCIGFILQPQRLPEMNLLGTCMYACSNSWLVTTFITQINRYIWPQIFQLAFSSELTSIVTTLCYQLIVFAQSESLSAGLTGFSPVGCWLISRRGAADAVVRPRGSGCRILVTWSFGMMSLRVSESSTVAKIWFSQTWSLQLRSEAYRSKAFWVGI